MSALQECYSRPGNPFGLLGPFYDALGHRGKDFYRPGRAPIIAYDDMEIISTPAWSGGLGWTVGLRRLNLGGFAGFAHIYGLMGSPGLVIPKGEPLAYVATWGDDPGDLWDGPHIHTTESWVSAYAAAVGVRPLTDPGPAIAAAIGSAPAAADTTPIGADMPLTESDIATLRTILNETATATIHQILGTGAAVYADANPGSVRRRAQAIQADLAYLHTGSPYSLRAIASAQDGMDLTDAQVAALGDRLVTGVTAGLADALDQDQEAVLAAIRALPAEVRGHLAAALAMAPAEAAAP